MKLCDYLNALLRILAFAVPVLWLVMKGTVE